MTSRLKLEKSVVTMRDHATTTVRRRGEGVPLVLVHSLGLDHRAWGPFMESCPSDLDIVAYDVRGHGDHDAPALFDISSCVGDLKAILDVLGFDRVHVCGLSMGGVIAQEFAFAYPESLRGLTLMATISKGAPEIADRGIAGERLGLASQIPATLERWFSSDHVARGGPWIEYARDCLMSLDIHMWTAAWSALARTETWTELAKVSVPTLCVAGSGDVSTPVETLRTIAERIPGGRLATVSGPHLFPIEAPHETVQAVVDFHRKLPSLK